MAVAAGQVDIQDARYLMFQDLLLKEPEHTWGVSSACEGDYTDSQFYDPKYACTPGSSDFNITVKSFVDQRVFVDRAVVALADLPLRAQCEAALTSSDPVEPSLVGLTLFDMRLPVALADGVAVTFNASGAIVGLVRTGGRELAGPTNPIGLFSYGSGPALPWIDACWMW